jgi:hypothetical protein
VLRVAGFALPATTNNIWRHDKSPLYMYSQNLIELMPTNSGGMRPLFSRSHCQMTGRRSRKDQLHGSRTEWKGGWRTTKMVFNIDVNQHGSSMDFSRFIA